MNFHSENQLAVSSLPKSVDRKRGQRKGATSKNVKKIVKKCQKYFRHFSTFFRAGQKMSKIVKKCQTYFRHFSTIFARHQFSGPSWGALTEGNVTGNAQSRRRRHRALKHTILRCWGLRCVGGPEPWQLMAPGPQPAIKQRGP